MGDYNKTVYGGYKCTSPTIAKFHKSTADVRILLGPRGCLSPETEVMTPQGWVRIDSWNGQEVLEWDWRNGKCDYVRPKEYIVAGSEGFLKFTDTNGLSMSMSHNHRVPVYFDGVYAVLDAWRLANRIETEHVSFSIPSLHVDRIHCSDVTVTRVESEDGNQYCFDVPKGFFVARHNGCVFITGNSGKSFGAQGEVMMLAQEMPPCKDGVRRSAYAFLRDTATNLKDTTMVTWCKLFPEIINNDPRTGITKVTWSHPMDMRVQQDLPDGTRLDLMIYCRHQASPIDAENLKSLELTGFYANEVNMIPEACFFQAISSMGRYPDPRNLSVDPATGKPYVPRFCALADSNMPHEKHWLWQKYLNPPKGWEFFRQPPAMFYLGQSKNGRPLFQKNIGQRIAQGILPAENIANLGGGFKYYERQVYGRKLAESLVFVCAQPGVITDGLPVYGNYSADVHYSGQPIPFDIGKTLFLGFDWGLWPTCVFAQMNDAGQLQIIDMIDGEGEKMGIEQLWTGKLRAKLVNDYRWGSGAQIFAVGDPATGVSQVNMSTCTDYLQSQGLTVVPCVTNDPVERIGAVDHFLRSTVYGGKPAMVIAKAAYKIHEGMSGYYCLNEKVSAAGTSYSAVPDKNEWSHSQDCVQYIAHAVKNPALYNIEWRNRNNFGQSDITQLPTQPKVGMAGVV